MRKTYFLAGISIFLWSTVAVTTKLLLETYNNFQVLWVSVFCAFVFLAGWNTGSGKLRILKGYKLKDYGITILSGLLGTFFYYIFYYAGTNVMPASKAFIINYLWPIMSVVFACIILKEKMTFRKGIAILISFIGLCIVSGSDLKGFDATMLSGIIFCVMGAVMYGLFTALNQKYDYDKAISMMINYFVAFVLTSVINAVNNDLFIPKLSQLPGFVWNGVFTMAIACTVWVIALESGKTAKVSNLAYLTPFLSLIWTFLILKEPLNINSIAGLIVIVSGIFVQLKK